MLLSPANPTFLGSQSSQDLSKVETPYAFVGIPYGPVYVGREVSACAEAADVIRRTSHERSYTRFMSHWNFDLGEPQFEDNKPNVTDIGNVVVDPYDIPKVKDNVRLVLNPLVRKGIVPLVIGGQDSVPPLVVSAYDGVEDINVLQIDAHIDFRDEIYGRRDGASNTMRRVRDYGCVKDVIHFGTRSIGTARREEVEIAQRMGNRFISAWEIHDEGVDTFLETFNMSRKWVLTIDCDGMDPTIAPAVGVPEPGGLTFVQTAKVLRYLARKNCIAGVIFTEFQPDKDINGTTALTVARLLLNIIGIQRGPAKVPAGA